MTQSQKPTTKLPELSAELKGYIGRETGRKLVSPPIAASDIRKWAIAVYWPDQPPRIYWDEAYARATRFGGIIAPEEFNPFAWPIREPGEPMYRGMTIPDEAITRIGLGPYAMNGGNSNEYHNPMRPGDVITSQGVVEDLFIRGGRLGAMLFTIIKHTWTNQKGEVVRIARSTGIRY